MMLLSPQKSEKERLLQEHNKLQENLEEMQQNLCSLYKSVHMECDADQDHLQRLAKLSSPEFSITCQKFVGKKEESQIAVEMVSSTSECDPSVRPSDSLQTGELLAKTKEAACPVSASVLSASLDMTNSS